MRCVCACAALRRIALKAFDISLKCHVVCALDSSIACWLKEIYVRIFVHTAYIYIYVYISYPEHEQSHIVVSIC